MLSSLALSHSAIDRPEGRARVKIDATKTQKSRGKRFQQLRMIWARAGCRDRRRRGAVVFSDAAIARRAAFCECAGSDAEGDDAGGGGEEGGGGAVAVGTRATCTEPTGNPALADHRDGSRLVPPV
jgi:hypothetical protein